MTSRIARFAQHLGLAGISPRTAFKQASQLHLPFSPLPEPQPSVFWLDGSCLHRLLDLPRSALSGPVQEDKARALSALNHLVKKQHTHYPSVDLRQIDGMGGQSIDGKAYCTLEDFAATRACRQLRVISYKDFVRTLADALPHFQSGEPINLRQASWMGDRFYWAGEHHTEAFACAIAYARLRGLEILLPCELTDYRLDSAGLQALDNAYHAIAIPAQAWNDGDFMNLLLKAQVSYARLSLLRDDHNAELLLLEKKHAIADAIGEGLKYAGAPDMVNYLRNLPQITSFRLGDAQTI